MEKELMTRVELMERCAQLEKACLEASEAARRAVIVYQEEHGFGDYRAAQAEIMQKYDAYIKGYELYGKAVKGVSNE